MNYKNAAEILPEKLLKELQSYIEGDILYIPKSKPKKEWGMESGSRAYYLERNKRIREQFHEGIGIEQLAIEYGLSGSTIKKVIYGVLKT